MSPRSEPRVPRAVSVRIFCVNPQGGIINKTVQTVDISRLGVRVKGIESFDTVGEIVGISSEGRKSRYRIVWIGRPGTPHAGQIGLKCIDGEQPLWGDEIIASAEHKPEQVVASAGRPTGAADTRRKDSRFSVTGGANVRVLGTQTDHWARLHDISSTGCYVWSTAPHPPTTEVEISLFVDDVQIQMTGIIAATDRGVGMGIKFTGMNKLNRDRLNDLIGRLQSAST